MGFNNSTSYDIHSRTLKNTSPSFDDLNQVGFLSISNIGMLNEVYQLIAQVMCGVSTSLRFPGQLNGCVYLCSTPPGANVSSVI